MLPRFAVQGFIVTGPLFSDHEIAKALTTQGEDGLFESLILDTSLCWLSCLQRFRQHSLCSKSIAVSQSR